mgnify:CR=1 FL=1
MKAEELKTKTADELKKMLLDMKKEQFGLRLRKVQGQLENPVQVRLLRRNIARVQTALGNAASSAKAPVAAKKTAPKTKKAKA